MKDAKEWFKEMTRLDKEPPSWHDWVKMIQADARHSSLTEAIALCNGIGNDWESQGEANMSAGAIECAFKLLQLRDNHPLNL